MYGNVAKPCKTNQPLLGDIFCNQTLLRIVSDWYSHMIIDVRMFVTSKTQFVKVSLTAKC